MPDLHFKAIEYADQMPLGLRVTDPNGQVVVYEILPSDKKLSRDKRPRDPSEDGGHLTFTIEAGSVIPGKMPEAIRVTDDKGRTARYVPQGQRAT